jgi:hypothetical protein
MQDRWCRTLAVNFSAHILHRLCTLTEIVKKCSALPARCVEQPGSAAPRDIARQRDPSSRKLEAINHGAAEFGPQAGGSPLNPKIFRQWRQKRL